MSKHLQPVRGTRDVFGLDAIQQHDVIQQATTLMQGYGYKSISTPIFEESEVFMRTLGETSDVVTKETYTFLDREKTSITLRPELTAGLMRAIISNGMTQNLPQKFYAIGPIFRHERPQNLRYRQFTQIDCEYFGAKHPLTDVETIQLAADIITKLSLSNASTLEINSLGDKESRANYNQQLVAFLHRYENELSAESRNRLLKNPMRILDSKDEKDKKLLQNAPTIEDCYNQASRDYWYEVLHGLDKIGISYQINNKLVRGLDYYSHTVFEFTTNLLGSQGTVLAGGRFDGLAEMMGGPRIEAIGFAGGVERLVGLQQALAIYPVKESLIYFITLDAQYMLPAMKISNQLRKHNLIVHQDFTNNLSKSFRKADSMSAKFCLILGEDEIKKGIVKCKDMTTGIEKTVNIDVVETLFL